MFRSTVLALSFVALSLQPAAPQEKPHLGGITLSFTTSAVDPTVAEDHGIGERGYGGEMGGFIAFYRIFTISVDAGAMAVADHKKFSESTTGGTKKSSVSLYSGSLALGLRTPPLPNSEGASFTLGADLGHGWLSGSRGIDNCVDCTSEDIGIVGGNYVEPRFAIQFEADESPAELIIAYRAYSGSSGLHNRLLIGLGAAWRFGSKGQK